MGLRIPRFGLSPGIGLHGLAAHCGHAFGGDDYRARRSRHRRFCHSAVRWSRLLSRHARAGFPVWKGPQFKADAVVYRPRELNGICLLSNVVSAKRLETAVLPELERWRKHTGNPDAKLVLICHSRGGLVARWFLEAFGGREFTRQFITIATPHPPRAAPGEHGADLR